MTKCFSTTWLYPQLWFWLCIYCATCDCTLGICTELHTMLFNFCKILTKSISINMLHGIKFNLKFYPLSLLTWSLLCTNIPRLFNFSYLEWDNEFLMTSDIVGQCDCTCAFLHKKCMAESSLLVQGIGESTPVWEYNCVCLYTCVSIHTYACLCIYYVCVCDTMSVHVTV